MEFAKKMTLMQTCDKGCGWLFAAAAAEGCLPHAAKAKSSGREMPRSHASTNQVTTARIELPPRVNRIWLVRVDVDRVDRAQHSTLFHRGEEPGGSVLAVVTAIIAVSNTEAKGRPNVWTVAPLVALSLLLVVGAGQGPRGAQAPVAVQPAGTAARSTRRPCRQGRCSRWADSCTCAGDIRSCTELKQEQRCFAPWIYRLTGV
jgi:hypothetical protein